MADIFDRRRLLLFWAGWMLAVAALLSGLALTGWISPASLLVLTCLLNVGAAMNGPILQGAAQGLARLVTAHGNRLATVFDASFRSFMAESSRSVK